MEPATQIRPLANAIAVPVIRAYKVGGLGLVFVVIGTFLLVIAVAAPRGPLSYAVGGVGTLTILAVLAQFYYQSLRPLHDVRVNIKANEELINSIQVSAIQATELCYHLQSLAFKHADKVAPVVSLARQKLREVTIIPIFGNTPLARGMAEFADSEALVSAQDLSASIVEITDAARSVMTNLHRALVNADPKPIKSYCEQLRGIDNRVRDILKLPPNEPLQLITRQ